MLSKDSPGVRGAYPFGTLETAGHLSVQLFRGKAVDEGLSAAERIIAVPFSAPAHGSVDVGSIGGGTVLEIVPGEH
jgi:hypothetical protein